MQHTTGSTIELARKPPTLKAVDNTDWLKTAAIILVAVDHFGYFFVEHNEWWSVFGRLAAPTFFFLIGYAQTRIVPFHWIWLAAILTVLDSWNNDWKWVPPNILFNLALIRFARPHVQILLQNRGWIALALLVCAMFALLPIVGEIVDYGAEGWLWALFGLCQRMYVDRASALDARCGPPIPVASAHAKTQGAGVVRLLTCSLAALAYIWGEQREYSFAHVHFVAFILGVGVLCLTLCRFRRAASPLQPPQAVASTLRFIGRHTLEIYAIQLAGSELLIKLVPSLAP
jgi:uncharacterized membrane protein